MLTHPVPQAGLLFLLLQVFSLTSYSQSANDSSLRAPTTWGIFIGIDRTNEGVGNGYASKNASVFHDLWIENQRVDPSNSFLLLNDKARRTAFREALYQLRTAHPQDRVIIYISTPTLVEFTDSLTASGYLIPYDGLLNPKPDSSSRLIPTLELQDAVLTSPAREVLVFLDAPVSGLHAHSWPPPVNEPDLPVPSDTLGKHLLVAGRWGDSFFQAENGQSALVQSIIETLRSSVADVNNNGSLSFSELSQYSRARVNEQSQGHQFVQIRSYAGSRDIALLTMPSDIDIPIPVAPFLPTDSLTLTFESTPVSAKVFIDNTYLGNTPIQLNVAQWQDHSVRIQAEGYLPWNRVLTPDRAGDSHQNVHLLEDRAILNFAGIPSQHEIWINGIQEPMADLEPLQLATGNYQVIIRNENKNIVNRDLFLEPETSNRVTFKSQFSFSPALASFLFPGLGQFTEDARLKGIGFAAATLGALSVSLINNGKYQDRKDLFFQAQNAYNQARTPVQTALLRQEMLAQYDEVIEFNDKRRNMLYVALAIQGLSVLDALVFHSRKSVLQLEQKEGLTPFFSMRDDGMVMGVNIGL